MEALIYAEVRSRQGGDSLPAHFQAEQEMAAAQVASEAQAAAEARRKKQAAEDVHGEAETMRQRAWDDWKDDNPAGSGNSKLRPTA